MVKKKKSAKNNNQKPNPNWIILSKNDVPKSDKDLPAFIDNYLKNMIIGLIDPVFPPNVEEIVQALLNDGLILASFHQSRKRKKKGGKHWIVLSLGKSDIAARTFAQGLEYHASKQRVKSFWRVDKKRKSYLEIMVSCGHEEVHNINGNNCVIVCGDYSKATTDLMRNRCLNKMIDIKQVAEICYQLGLNDEVEEINNWWRIFAEKAYFQGTVNFPGKISVTLCPDDKCSKLHMIPPYVMTKWDNNSKNPYDTYDSLVFFKDNPRLWNYDNPGLWTCDDPHMGSSRSCGAPTWCVLCSWDGFPCVPYHFGDTCESWQRKQVARKEVISKEELVELKKAGMGVCPNNDCKARFMKDNNGCDKMQCSNCGTKFCFICGEITPTYRHYSNDGRLGTYGCPKRATGDFGSRAAVGDKEEKEEAEAGIDEVLDGAGDGRDAGADGDGRAGGAGRDAGAGAGAGADGDGDGAGGAGRDAGEAPLPPPAVDLDAQIAMRLQLENGDA